MLGRAPLLWVATPLIAGYVLGGVWPAAAPGRLFAFALPSLLAGTVLAIKGPQPAYGRWRFFKVWGACFVAAAILLAWAWHNMVEQPPPDWSGRPPREAAVTLRVLQNFRQPPGADYAGGLGKVVSAPPLLRELAGRPIYFRVRARTGEPPPARGATVEVQGLLRFVVPVAPGPDTAPQEVSSARFAAYLHAQGAWFELVRARVRSEVSPPGWWNRWLATQHARIDAVLRLGPAVLADKYGDIYVALALGEPSLLNEQQHAAFTEAGTVYLFAISGLHVCILAGALWYVLRRLTFIPQSCINITTLAVLWLYTEIAGGGPSARRAALMFTIYLVAGWLGRARSALPAVLAAGVLTLIIDPLSLLNTGFEFSYGVVLALVLYAMPLHEALRRRFSPWRDVPADSLAPWKKCVVWTWQKALATLVVTWTALLYSSPLTATYFGVFSAHGLTLNLLIIPLTCLVLWMAAAAVGAGIWGVPPFGWVAWAANAVGLAGVALMQFVARLTPPIPGFFVHLRVEPHWAGPAAALGILATMLLGQSRYRPPRWWFYLLPFVILAVFAAYAVRPM